MPQLEFRSGVPDAVRHTLVVLRKAYAQGARVAVTGDPALLDQIDVALWTDHKHDFVPHLRLAGTAHAAEHQRRTPLWLVDQATQAHDCSVLVNVGAGVPLGFEAFARIIDVATSDAAGTQAGRQRWRHYVAQGLTPEHRPMGKARGDDSQPSSAFAAGDLT
jgi:DNA polymerase III subunit chi